MKRSDQQTFTGLQTRCLKVLLPGILALTTPFISGCSGFSLPGFGGESARTTRKANARVAQLPLELDVFSARGFLGGSEYERYYLTDSILWRECGDIARSGKAAAQKLEGDEVFHKDPSLALRQRRVEALTPDQQAQLKQKASELLGSLAESELQAPPPGSVFSLSDPGLFELSIKLGGKKHRLITSVDAVADRNSRALEQIHELFALVRGVGPTICDSPTFFGITRKEVR